MYKVQCTRDNVTARPFTYQIIIGNLVLQEFSIPPFALLFKTVDMEMYELAQWQKDDLDTPSKVSEPDMCWEDAKKIIRSLKS